MYAVNGIDDFDWNWDILNETVSIDDFVCSESEHHFERFLKDLAIKYQKERLAVTYTILVGNKVIAYYTLANDKICMNEEERNLWNKLARKISNKKRRSGYPALKICQLAVDDYYANNGFGRQIIHQVIMFAMNFKVGCRFVTVDALPQAEEFYSKMNFKRLSNKPNSKNNTIPMYFDLGRLSDI